jgi:transposase InsO family protein
MPLANDFAVTLLHKATRIGRDAECVYAEHYATREQSRLSITEYLAYFTTERLHSSLEYVSPSEFERRWRAGNQRNEEPAS